MADSLICNAEPKTPAGGLSESPLTPSSGSPFQRRIEFHPARKPFSGIGNGGGDFRLETLNPTSSDPQRTGANWGPMSAFKGKKSEGSDVLENGLDPEISWGITFRRIGAGLENLGNTCFLNSVLQCLTYTEPLAAYLQSGKHQTSCHIAGFCALCAIQKHVSRALQSTGRILAPKDLVSNLRCISRNFRNARQEDAHEYMVNLLESMHKCCLPSGVPSESPSAYEKSLVHKIFGGRLRSQVKCMQCSYCSNTFDPFLDLSLEIGKAESLQKALTHFTATEQLDGGERQYQCQRCKQKVKALKQLTVYKAPYVLTVHLKRFRYHDPGQKIDKKVHFGPTLDLKPFEGDLKYTLYGVLVHAGWSTHSGHYYCFVRTSSGMWYSLDDNRVVQVNERTVLEQKAYMLFYVRDRRNVAPKKPVDVVQKENMVANAFGSKIFSTSNQGLKEAVQKGPLEKTFNAADTSAAVAQRYALNVGSSKEILLKEVSVQKINGSTMAECMAPKKEPQLESSLNAPLLKDLGKGLSVLKPKVEECLLPSGLSVQSGGDTPNLVNASVTKTSAKLNDCNDGSSKKDLTVSVAIPRNCNGHQSPAANRLVTDKTSQKVNILSNTGVLGIAPARNPSDRTSDKIDPVRSPNRQRSENGQVGGIPNGPVAGDSPSEKSIDNGLKLSVNGSVELSSSSIMMKGTLQMKDHKPHRKPKKKVLKCRVANMHFGPNILFGASLSLRKKKKHKWNKRRTLEKLLNETDMGPSTSEITRKVSLASTHSRRKRVKSGSKSSHNGNTVKEVINSNNDSAMNLIDGEFNKRIGQSGVVLAADKQPEKSSSSSLAANHCDAREPDISKEIKEIQCRMA
ncbi:hypothetical protein L1049_022142 [Liquidambar formosana]|uniref:Ubiquitin carboxyl-terminal hydrolase n=1 Tax=Liquidambar formosana TaxID=63359 RepID=A0AAP0RE12_LIQFO